MVTDFLLNSFISVCSDSDKAGIIVARTEPLGSLTIRRTQILSGTIVTENVRSPIGTLAIISFLAKVFIILGYA